MTTRDAVLKLRETGRDDDAHLNLMDRIMRVAASKMDTASPGWERNPNPPDIDLATYLTQAEIIEVNTHLAAPSV